MTQYLMLEVDRNCAKELAQWFLDFDNRAKAKMKYLDEQSSEYMKRMIELKEIINKERPSIGKGKLPTKVRMTNHTSHDFFFYVSFL